MKSFLVLTHNLGYIRQNEVLEKMEPVFASSEENIEENHSIEENYSEDKNSEDKSLSIDYSSQFGNLSDLIKNQGFTSYWMSHFVSDFKNQNPNTNFLYFTEFGIKPAPSFQTWNAILKPSEKNLKENEK